MVRGQMIASVLSKKVVAGSTHVVIDIPIGKTAKVSGRRR
jgi:thymidine phosphorylase